MCPAIVNPTSCEILALICFLQSKNTSSTEAHLELCAAIYGQNVMSEGRVRQRCGNSAECSNMGEQTNVYDEERSGRPSVVSDDIVQIVDQK
jgi:hypothetical protein